MDGWPDALNEDNRKEAKSEGKTMDNYEENICKQALIAGQNTCNREDLYIYDYTKLFGLWKRKGSELDLKIMRYIHGKDLDAKILLQGMPN